MLSSTETSDEPILKKLKSTESESANKSNIEYSNETFDKLFFELEHSDQKHDSNQIQFPIPNSVSISSKENDQLDEEINKALLTFNEFNENKNILNQPKLSQIDSKINGGDRNKLDTEQQTSSPSENLSPFDSPPDTLAGSITSNEEATSYTNRKPTEMSSHINQSTVLSIKQSMINTSKLISTFTTLKTTYLKLCKEFNYLLNKFNENERIKIELINENNELKNLLMEIIKERELERKKFTSSTGLARNSPKDLKRKYSDISSM